MTTKNLRDKIIVVGAGLAGSLLSLYLAKQGFRVVVYEKLPDMRKNKLVGGRSINLALSLRGIRPLEEVGVIDEILKIALPMIGREIHNSTGEKKFQPYGKDSNKEYINSVSRGELNKILMTAAEQTGKVQIIFNANCASIDLQNGEVEIKRENNKLVHDRGQTVIATDGVGSAIRFVMQRTPLFNYSQDFLKYGYKELEIPENDYGKHKITNNVLHIWPRGKYMLIALPNPDGSFTATMFHPYTGEGGFDSLSTDEEIKAFFQSNYPELLELIPDVIEQYKNNPVGILGTIKCNPWYYSDKVLLIGDSSHAIVPFYGQGMNAAFEDCRIFNELITQYGSDWQTIYPIFNSLRKENTDAIADLALDNFIEMRDRVADSHFLRLKQAELLIYETYPEIMSKYSMVTFSHMPYSEAKIKGEILLEIVNRYLKDEDAIENFPLQQAYEEIVERYQKLNEE